MALYRSIVELQNFGVALCNGAHLGNLRAFSHKFLSFLTVRLDGDLGLRCPNVLWASIAELMNDQGWTLDECLCEFTNVRSDLATLLQPRPKISKPPPIPPTLRPPGKGSKGYGKPKGKSSKGGKGKQTWVSEFQHNGEWKQICMKVQSNNCRMDNCRFAHVCTVPRCDNTACAGKHSAFDHQSTGHCLVESVEDQVSTPNVSHAESFQLDSAVSTDTLQVSASECDATKNSVMEEDRKTNNEWPYPSP